MKNPVSNPSPLESYVFNIIKNAGKPVSFREIYNELKKQLFVSESGVDYAIDKLELRGLITRKKIKTDEKGQARLHYMIANGKQEAEQYTTREDMDAIELLKWIGQDAVAYIESGGDVPVNFTMPDGRQITNIHDLLEEAMKLGAWIMTPSRYHGWSMFSGSGWREVAAAFPEAHMLFAPGFYVKIPKNMLK